MAYEQKDDWYLFSLLPEPEIVHFIKNRDDVETVLQGFVAHRNQFYYPTHACVENPNDKDFLMFCFQSMCHSAHYAVHKRPQAIIKAHRSVTHWSIKFSKWLRTTPFSIKYCMCILYVSDEKGDISPEAKPRIPWKAVRTVKAFCTDAITSNVPPVNCLDWNNCIFLWSAIVDPSVRTEQKDPQLRTTEQCNCDVLVVLQYTQLGLRAKGLTNHLDPTWSNNRNWHHCTVL